MPELGKYGTKTDFSWVPEGRDIKGAALHRRWGRYSQWTELQVQQEHHQIKADQGGCPPMGWTLTWTLYFQLMLLFAMLLSPFHIPVASPGLQSTPRDFHVLLRIEDVTAQLGVYSIFKA